MAQSSHLAWLSPEDRSHVAARNRSLSLVALLLTPALGTAVMIAQINRKLCHLLLINPSQRKGHPNSSEERNVHWAAVRQPVSVQSTQQAGHGKAGKAQGCGHPGRFITYKK